MGKKKPKTHAKVLDKRRKRIVQGLKSRKGRALQGFRDTERFESMHRFRNALATIAAEFVNLQRLIPESMLPQKCKELAKDPFCAKVYNILRQIKVKSLDAEYQEMARQRGHKLQPLYLMGWQERLGVINRMLELGICFELEKMADPEYFREKWLELWRKEGENAALLVRQAVEEARTGQYESWEGAMKRIYDEEWTPEERGKRFVEDPRTMKEISAGVSLALASHSADAKFKSESSLLSARKKSEFGPGIVE
jgi:hypothetical protein